MNEKRYSIVRVDNKCPVVLEEDINLTDRIKMFPCFNDKRISCEKCRYGDTKEQMVRKAAQTIKRELKGDCVAGLKDTIFIQKWCIVETLAKKIIESLGVK